MAEQVRFINNTAEVIKTLQGLSKQALRASGKEIRKILRERLPVRSKRIRNHIASWVFVERTTGQPQMQVGFQSWQRVKKRGKLPSHANPHWLEFGTATHTIAARNAKVMAYQENIYGKVARHGGQREGHILRNAVHDNIAEIRAAQEKFLEALSGELDRAKGMMQQDSEEPEDD